MPYLGELKPFVGNFAPQGWAICDGSIHPVLDGDPYFALFTVIKFKFGGNGLNTFALPDLRGRAPVGAGQGAGISQNYTVGQYAGAEYIQLTGNQLASHNHQAVGANGDNDVFFQGSVNASMKVNNTTSDSEEPDGKYLGLSDGGEVYSDLTTGTQMDPLSTTVNNSLVVDNAAIQFSNQGSSESFSVHQPSIAYNWIICLSGRFPAHSGGNPQVEDQFIGEIRAFAGDWIPDGWLACDGANYPNAQGAYTILGAIIGNSYGGSQGTNFNVPDLRGRLNVCKGQGAGLNNNYAIGQKAGSDAVTLSADNLPAHSHVLIQNVPVNGSITASVNVNNSDNDAGEEPGGNFLGKSDGGNIYASSSDGSTLAADAVTVADNFGMIKADAIQIENAGESSPIAPIQPVIAINWIICYTGNVPNRQ